MIENSFIDELLQHLDIVEVVGGYIPLKKAGANFKALCPFHNEKTPSFVVGPQKQIFHCFGCGVGGNAINFVMRHEKLTFREAVEQLARKAGMKMPDTRPAREDAPVITHLRKANLAAALFYHGVLKSMSNAAPARKYLADRQLKDPTIDFFKVGFAPHASDEFIAHMRTQGIAPDTLVEAGLCARDERGSLYARFRDRIMFPIFDIKSHVIGFGGRILQGEALAKYINSPETKIYSKGSHLYGLHASLEDIKKEDAVIIVEGYMDYLMPFQSGIRNIVASLGTSLTARQIRQLKRYTRAIVLLYDPDEAGELATLRGLDLLLEEDMSVKVAVLPEGLDPDTFTVRHGAAKLQQLIQEAHNLFEYKLEVLCGKFNKKEVGQKIKIIEEMLPTIKRVKNEVLRLEYVRKLSEALGVSEQALITELKKVKSEHARYETSEHAEIMISEQSLPAAEKLAIGLMLSDAKLCALFHSSVALNDFRHHHLRKMADMIFAHTRAGGELSPHALMHMCDDEALTAIITQAILEAEVVEDKARVAQDCIARIRKDSGKSKLQQIQELIKEAEAARDEQRVNELMREYSALVRTHFK